MPEVHVCVRFVVRIGRVVDPHQGVRVDVDDLFQHKLSPIAVATGGVQLVEFIHLPVLFVAAIFLCSCVQVHPIVAVIELSCIEFAAVVKLVRPLEVELVVQQVKHILVFPIHRLFPIQQEALVDETIQFLTLGVFSYEVAVVVVVCQRLKEQRVTHVVHELAVFVVGDFVDVHVKRRDGHRFGTCVQGEGDILVTGPHGVGTEVDVIHPVGVRLVPVLALLNADQFALGPHVARRQHDGCQQDHQELFHGLYFLQRLGRQQRFKDMVSCVLTRSVGWRIC